MCHPVHVEVVGYNIFCPSCTLRENLQGVPVEEVGSAPAGGPPDAGALVTHGGECGADALALAAPSAVVPHVDGVGAKLVFAAST